MRASEPSAPDPAKPEALVMTVENEAQSEYVGAAMADLLAHLRSRLGNTAITLTVNINAGQGAFHTWNDRELIARMREENPQLARFMDDFKMIIS